MFAYIPPALTGKEQDLVHHAIIKVLETGDYPIDRLRQTVVLSEDITSSFLELVEFMVLTMAKDYPDALQYLTYELLNGEDYG